MGVSSTGFAPFLLCPSCLALHAVAIFESASSKSSYSYASDPLAARSSTAFQGLLRLHSTAVACRKIETTARLLGARHKFGRTCPGPVPLCLACYSQQ